MPAIPQGEIVTVGSSETETSLYGLPLRLVETVITMPDGRQSVLKGGFAAPYSWFPQPFFGCTLISSEPSWKCFHQFSRDGFTTIVSSKTKYGGDLSVLATALGLEQVPFAELEAVATDDLEIRLKEAVDAQLEQDVADLRASVADPAKSFSAHSTRVLVRTPERLLSLAPEIVEGIERAAIPSDNPYRNRETGKTLAMLFGRLPLEVQDRYAGQMRLLYDRSDAANDGRHWLYQAEALLRFRRPWDPQDEVKGEDIVIVGNEPQASAN